MVVSELRAAIRSAASHMTGFERRKYMAAMANEQCNSSPRQTETSFGFNRRAVSRGGAGAGIGETNLPQAALPRSAIHCDLPTLCNSVGLLVRLFFSGA